VTCVFVFACMWVWCICGSWMCKNSVISASFECGSCLCLPVCGFGVSVVRGCVRIVSYLCLSCVARVCVCLYVGLVYLWFVDV